MERIDTVIVGGEPDGSRLTGRIRPVGSDRLVVRPDGVGILDLRATFETEDGAVIDAPFIGVIDLGENGYEDLLEGKLAPDGTTFRSTPRYQTAHLDYQWPNWLRCGGIGQVFPTWGEARCAIYEVSCTFALGTEEKSNAVAQLRGSSTASGDS